MADKEVKTENFEHCIEAQSLCLGFTSSNVPHLSAAKINAPEAPLRRKCFQNSDHSPEKVQVFSLAFTFRKACSLTTRTASV